MIRLLLVFIISAPTLLFGQTEFTPCKDVSGFSRQYAEASKNLNTLKCKFTQEKSISMLKNKLTSRGEFAFKKNDMLRMEFKQPYIYLFILNGTKVYILDNQKKTELSSGNNKLFKKISQITVSCVRGDILNSKDFTNKVSESKNQYLLELTPVSKEIKEYFNLFKIYIAKTDHLVDKIEMSEASGDKTTIVFTEKQINIPLNDAIFTLK